MCDEVVIHMDSSILNPAMIIVYQTSLAVEGLNREEIGIEEIVVPNEAESNGQ